MHSSETEPEDSEELPKLPFRRLRLALHQVVDVAIPLHIQLLREQGENIERLTRQRSHLELRSEQVKSAKTVQLLKADLYELEQLNRQVREEDQDLFQSTIRNQIRDAVDVLSNFMSVHSDVLGPFPDIEFDDEPQFPNLVLDLSKESSDEIASTTEIPAPQLQVLEPKKRTGWSFLRKELLEINALMSKFASLVFKQQDNVDDIQRNIVETSENVRAGTEFLKKASLLKAASFPVAGALIGGLVLGPVGALIGFKVLGSMACVAGGSAIGYTAGSKIKQKHQAICDIELKPLAYPKKSNSNPELNAEPKKDQ